MRCQQPPTQYPQFSCGSTATFRVRWVNPDKELKVTHSCALHLSRACRRGFEDNHPEYPGAQVNDLRAE